MNDFSLGAINQTLNEIKQILLFILIFLFLILWEISPPWTERWGPVLLKPYWNQLMLWLGIG